MAFKEIKLLLQLALKAGQHASKDLFLTNSIHVSLHFTMYFDLVVLKPLI